MVCCVQADHCRTPQTRRPALSAATLSDAIALRGVFRAPRKRDCPDARVQVESPTANLTEYVKPRISPLTRYVEYPSRRRDQRRAVMAWWAWGIATWFVACAFTLPPFILSGRISRAEEAAEYFWEPRLVPARKAFAPRNRPYRSEITDHFVWYGETGPSLPANMRLTIIRKSPRKPFGGSRRWVL